MPPPAVYLDECVHLALEEALRRRGFDVTAAHRRRAGLDDERQLAHAGALGSVLLTYNRRDFERLHRTYERLRRTHSGIVVLQQKPPLHVQEIRAAMMLDWIATLPDHQSQLFKWSQLQRLLDHGARLAGYTDADVHLACGWTAG